MATIDVAKQDAAGAARRHSGWIVKVARAGYAAKGVIYVIIGVLALQAALGAGGGTTDSGGALQVVEGSPFGRALLGVMGVGLIGYALWALLSASLDAEDRGTDAKGIALRIGQAARGIAYGALGVEALRLLSRASSGSAGG